MSDLRIAALKDECRGRAENEDRLRAENAKLRAALEHIANENEHLLDAGAARAMKNIARAALEETK